VDSNYDPCADLSAILITIKSGMANSNKQALMFHRGIYVGPATSTDFNMTTLDKAASTNNTVVLKYETGQTCNACGDGTFTAVRYRWNGTAVQRLDPLPPGIT
jgi:LppP/LprE lipoprotein